MKINLNQKFYLRIYRLVIRDCTAERREVSEDQKLWMSVIYLAVSETSQLLPTTRTEKYSDTEQSIGPCSKISSARILHRLIITSCNYLDANYFRVFNFVH